MREEEAKTKWCPMVRILIAPNDAAWQNNMVTNRGDIPASNTDLLCIGSECMMWVTNGFSNVGDCGLKREPEANG